MHPFARESVPVVVQRGLFDAAMKAPSRVGGGGPACLPDGGHAVHYIWVSRIPGEEIPPIEWRQWTRLDTFGQTPSSFCFLF